MESKGGSTHPLLTCDEEKFDELIENMDSQELIDATTALQEEMGFEQHKFNRLSTQHTRMEDKFCPEYEELSKQLAESQARLGVVVARNMKCFNQETSRQNQDLFADLNTNEERAEQTSHSQSSPDQTGPEIVEFDWLEPDSMKDQEPENTTEMHTSTFKMRSAPPIPEETYPLKSSSSGPVVEQLITFDSEPEQVEKQDLVPTKAHSSIEIVLQPTEVRPDVSAKDVPIVQDPELQEVQSSWERAGDRQSRTSTTSDSSAKHDSYVFSSSQPESMPVNDTKSPDLKHGPESIPAWQAPGDRNSGSSSSSGSSGRIQSYTIQSSPSASDDEHSKPTALTAGVKTKVVVQTDVPSKPSAPDSKPARDTGSVQAAKTVVPVAHSKPPTEQKPVVSFTTQSKISERAPPSSKAIPASVSYGKVQQKPASGPPVVTQTKHSSSVPVSKPSTTYSHTVTPTQQQKKTEPILASKSNENNNKEQPSQNVPKPRIQLVSVSKTRQLFERSDADATKNAPPKKPMVRPSRTAPTTAPSGQVVAVKQTPKPTSEPVGQKATAVATSTTVTFSQNATNVAKPSVDTETEKEQSTRVTTGRSGELIMASGSGRTTQPTRVLLRAQPQQEEVRSSQISVTSSVPKTTAQSTTTAPVTTTTASKVATTTKPTNYPPIAKKPPSPIKTSAPMLPTPPMPATNGDVSKYNMAAAAPGEETMLASPLTTQGEGFTSDDKVKDRVTLTHWDPKLLLDDLYKITLEPKPDDRHIYINMEGYLEKLPLNKRKATLLKTWKRRFFRAEEGTLYYFEIGENEDSDENHNHDVTDKAGGYFQLVGGEVEEIGDGMLGLDDGRGRYMIVKPPTEAEFQKWKKALESQTVERTGATHIKPVMVADTHPSKKVVVIDLGSCNVRAGILGRQATLPKVFFPTVVATDKQTGERVFGFEAFGADVRAKCNLAYPVRSSDKVDKFSLDFNVMPDLIGKIFRELKVNPAEYLVMFSAPATLSDKMKEQFMNIFINQYHVKGVNIVNQTLLALYSYGARSGIVVDIGERLEIVPITDGYIVEQGSTRQPYGGKRITEAFNSTLTERRYRFFTDASFQIVRLAMEQLCYVCPDFAAEIKKYQKDPQSVRKSVDLAKYDLPKGSWTHVSQDLGRFQSPEGLFDLEAWGMDNPPLQKLVQKAVQACPMDTRREMWRSIFLSGGVTLMPGFVDRLQAELVKLVPASIVVQIHAAPQRYHSAFIGACTLADMNVFEQSCISADEWKTTGPPSLRKWHLF